MIRKEWLTSLQAMWGQKSATVTPSLSDLTYLKAKAVLTPPTSQIVPDPDAKSSPSSDR